MKGVIYASYRGLGDIYSHPLRPLPELMFVSRPALWQAYEERRQIWHIPPIEVHEGWTVQDIAERE
jgi:hypothetical protein